MYYCFIKEKKVEQQMCYCFIKEKKIEQQLKVELEYVREAP